MLYRINLSSPRQYFSQVATVRRACLQVSLQGQATDGRRASKDASFSGNHATDKANDERRASKDASFSGVPATDKAAASNSPCSGAYSSGEMAAEERCVTPQRMLSQLQQAGSSGHSSKGAPSSATTAAPPLPPLKRSLTATPRPTGARTWEGLPLTSLADASEGCDEGAGGAAALRLGLFRFKGSPETLSMVDVVPASLAGRR